MSIVRPHIARTPLKKPRYVKIAVVGNTGVGKSKLLSNMRSVTGSSNDDENFTVGVSLLCSSGQLCKFIFFDCGGDDRFSTIRSEIYKEVEGLIICFNDKLSFLSIESKWMLEARDLLKLTPVVVCSLDSSVPDAQVLTWANERGFLFAKVIKNDISEFLKTLSNAFSHCNI